MTPRHPTPLTAGDEHESLDTAALATSPTLLASARLCSEVLDLDAQHSCAEDDAFGVCWPYLATSCPDPAASRSDYPNHMGAFVSFCRTGSPLPPKVVRNSQRFERAFRGWETAVHEARAASDEIHRGTHAPVSAPARYACDPHGTPVPEPTGGFAIDDPVTLDTATPSASRSLLSGSFDATTFAQGLAEAIEQRAQEELEVFVVEKLGTLLCGDVEDRNHPGWTFLRASCTLLDAARAEGAQSMTWAALREALENDVRRLPGAIAQEVSLELDAESPARVALRIGLYLVSALVESTDPAIVIRRLADAVASDAGMPPQVALSIRFLESVFSLVEGPPVRETAFLGVLTTLEFVGASHALKVRRSAAEQQVGQIRDTLATIGEAADASDEDREALQASVDLDALELGVSRTLDRIAWMTAHGDTVLSPPEAGGSAPVPYDTHGLERLESLLRLRRVLSACARPRHQDEVASRVDDAIFGRRVSLEGDWMGECADGLSLADHGARTTAWLNEVHAVVIPALLARSDDEPTLATLWLASLSAMSMHERTELPAVGALVHGESYASWRAPIDGELRSSGGVLVATLSPPDASRTVDREFPLSLRGARDRSLDDAFLECLGNLDACPAWLVTFARDGDDATDRDTVVRGAQHLGDQRRALIRELRELVRGTVGAIRALGDPAMTAESRAAQLESIAVHQTQALDLVLRLATRDSAHLPLATGRLVVAVAHGDLAAIVSAALDVTREVLGDQLQGAVPQPIVRSFSLAAQVLEAETSDDVRDAVLAFAAPVGSWRGKRDGQYRLYLNALVGLTGGAEVYSNVPYGYAATSAVGLGAHASVGLYMNVGAGGAPGHSPSAFGLYVPVVDVTPWTSLSTLAGETVRLDQIDPLSILSPGLYAWIGVADTPLVIAIGYSYTPHGRTALHLGATGEQVAVPIDAHRVQLVLGVDVTLLPF